MCFETWSEVETEAYLNQVMMQIGERNLERIKNILDIFWKDIEEEALD